MIGSLRPQRLSPSGHGEQWSSVVTMVPRLLAQRYQKGPRLGQGVYGTVYKAIDRREDRSVALKVVEDQDGVANPVVTREISMLRLLNGHPFIIELQDVFAESDTFVMVMETADMTLSTFLEATEEGMPESESKRLSFQLLSSLLYMHSQGIIHRDLKPDNILMCGRDMKICDFGLSTTFTDMERPRTPGAATLLYRAPELYFEGEMYGTSVDVWAAGCIIAEMIRKAPLFNGTSEMSILRDVLTKIYPISEPKDLPLPKDWQILVGEMEQDDHFFESEFSTLSPEGFIMIKKMLVLKPSHRLNLYEALTSDYFKDTCVEYHYLIKSFGHVNTIDLNQDGPSVSPI